VTVFLLRIAAVGFLPVLVLVSLWYSLVDHYYVPSPKITNAVAEASRLVPEDDVLRELSSFYFMPTIAALEESLAVEAAERLLQHGEFALPGEAPQRVRLPFDSRELDRGPVVWQLQDASLFVPRLLVKAYRISGREEFFLAARDVLLAWSQYERHAVVPSGLLWNDHAIAERALALSDFWAVYRSHPAYEVGTGVELLTFAARCGSFLGDPSYFTVSTNHGVMQNLALWHLALAFPLLPDSERYRQIAFERLREQMDFYVSAQGAILEHSAGYQLTGVDFLGLAFLSGLRGADSSGLAKRLRGPRRRTLSCAQPIGRGCKG
jgi:hypothetical protein